VERSHEKGAYLDEIKSEMRRQRTWIREGRRSRPEKAGKRERGGGGVGGQRGREPVSGLDGYGRNINLGLV